MLIFIIKFVFWSRNHSVKYVKIFYIKHYYQLYQRTQCITKTVYWDYMIIMPFYCLLWLRIVSNLCFGLIKESLLNVSFPFKKKKVSYIIEFKVKALILTLFYLLPKTNSYIRQTPSTKYYLFSKYFLLLIAKFLFLFIEV